MRTLLFCSLAFLSPAFAMDVAEIDGNTEVSDLKQQIKDRLTIIHGEKAEDLSDLVKQLPAFQRYKRREIALSAGAFAGAGLATSLVLKSYASAIEDSLKMVFSDKVDKVSEQFIAHPWLYPTIAATASIGGALFYARKKLLRPFQLDQGAEDIVAGFKEGQKTRLELQSAHYGSNYDRQIVTDEDRELFGKCLNTVTRFVTQASNKVADSMTVEDPNGDDVVELLKFHAQVQEKLDRVNRIKESKKKFTFKNDPITKTAQTLVAAVGLGLLKQYPQTRGNLLNQSTPDAVSMLAATGIVGSFACNYARKSNQIQFHNEIVDFLKNNEEEKRKAACDGIVEVGIEIITEDQGWNREVSQQILKLDDPLRTLLRKYQIKKASELEKVSMSKEDYKHLLIVVDSILEAFLNSLAKIDDKK
jgi:hypothetical protein